MSTVHTPVLLKEVIEYLNPQPGQNFIDCTFGGGGHSLEILKRIGHNGKLLAIDADKETRNQKSEIRKSKNFLFINDNFKNLKKIVEENFKYPVHGILLDLGLSSDQLEKSGRGFSFQKNEPLDMRFDTSQDLTAAHIINSYSLEDLYDIFKNYGDYPHARRLSKIIFRIRKVKKFKTTKDLVDAVLEACCPGPRYLKLGFRQKDKWHRSKFALGARGGMSGIKKRIHPATQVFQALRIAVNNELENLKQVLPQAVDILAKGGRLVVISFHALEDKIVKVYFRELSRAENPKIKLLTKKPISPSSEEVKSNPRSRSAKMRVVQKL